jgi:tetratricopeptide (TPR) repeat protein
MKKNQIIVVVIAVVIGILLFVFGNTQKPKAVVEGDNHQHSEAPMMMGGLDDVTPADIQSLVAVAKKKLKPEVLSNIELLEKQLATTQTAAEKTEALDKVGRFWHDQKNRLFAAYYVGQSGILDNSEKKLTFASHLLSEDIGQENDPSIRKLMFDVANACYEQLIAKNPHDADVVIDHKLLIINGAGNVMQGVVALRNWSDEHPENKRAHLILGSMSIQSQQFDKALERADKVLSLDSQNLEAYLLKSQTYQVMGEKDKAIEVLNDAKKMMNNPQFSKDVDEFIKQMN